MTIESLIHRLRRLRRDIKPSPQMRALARRAVLASKRLPTDEASISKWADDLADAVKDSGD